MRRLNSNVRNAALAVNSAAGVFVDEGLRRLGNEPQCRTAS